MSASGPGWPTILEAAATEAYQRGEQAWIVGGCLRDVLLGWPARDVDLALAGDPAALARAIASRAPGAALVPLPHGVRAVRLVWPGADHAPAVQLDLAPLRGATIGEDLAARDFTINALALPVSAWPQFVALARDPTDAASGSALALPDLLDPLAGLADVRGHALRVASAHALADDPLRILRGVRLAAWLGLTITPETEALAREAAPALGTIAPERLSEELWGLLALPAAADGLEWLHAQDALAPLLSELCDSPTGAAHAIATLKALDGARTDLADGLSVDGRASLGAWYASALSGARARWLVLRWAALLHGIAPHAPPAAWPAAWQVGDAPAGAGLPLPRREGTDPGVALAVRVAKRMGLATRERDVVRGVAAQQGLPALVSSTESTASLDDRLARRYFARTGEVGIDVLLVALACARAGSSPDADTPPAEYGSMLAMAWRLASLFLLERKRVLPSPLVNGSVLAAQLGAPPGPWLGRMLEAIHWAQVEGTIASADEALRLAEELYTRHQP